MDEGVRRRRSPTVDLDSATLELDARGVHRLVHVQAVFLGPQVGHR